MASCEKPASKKTILCVDDEVHILSALTRLLRPHADRILTANNGEEGLRLAREERPDLIFLDVMMPGMSGFEVLRSLRDLTLSGVPVVMLTGQGSGDALRKGYEEGCVYYITKPFKNEVVTNVVQYLIGDLAEAERTLLEQSL